MNDTEPQSAAVPAVPDDPGALQLYRGESGNLPASLRILLDPQASDRVKALAGVMSRATGFTPQHLIGKPEACHVVINMALDWRLSPYFVARGTYQTPGGQIGFMGFLVDAIMQQSGRLSGGITTKYMGDWQILAGKFTLKKSDKGKDFAVPTWTREEVAKAGLGIILSAKLIGEELPRYWPSEDEPFYLSQCWPLNSPLWATDPKSQIRYLAVRRFANMTMPHLLGGLPFDQDDFLAASEAAVDVTPRRPRREDFIDEQPAEPEPEPYEIVDVAGEVHRTLNPDRASEAFMKYLDVAHRSRGADGVVAMWESNGALFTMLEERGRVDLSRGLSQYYAQVREAAGERQAETDDDGASEREPAQEADPPASPAPETAKAAPAAPQPPRSPIWQDPDLVLPWSTPQKMRDDLVFLIGDANTTDELFRLRRDNDKSINRLAVGAKAFKEEVMTAFAVRERGLGQEGKERT